MFVHIDRDMIRIYQSRNDLKQNMSPVESFCAPTHVAACTELFKRGYTPEGQIFPLPVPKTYGCHVRKVG